MVTPVLAEFLGTTVLIAAIAFIGNPMLIVGAFAVAVYFAGPISGAHFNPAVTVWALLSGKLSQNKALCYIAAQLLAAVTVFAAKKLV